MRGAVSVPAASDSPPPAALLRWGGWTLAAAALAAVACVADSLAPAGRWTLAVFIACLAGWTLTRWRDSSIAIVGVAVLVAAGVLSPPQLARAAGNELVLLLAAAGLLAHALHAGGVAERLAARACAGAGSVRALAYRLALPIGLSAFAIPSTTGRAALLLPVFVALAGALRDERQTQAFALLFPSVILLSAGAALTGAGAHLVAVEAIAAQGGPRLGALDWALYGLPFAALSVAAAVELILRLTLSPADRAAAPRLPPPAGALTLRQRALLGILALAVVAWLTAGWHGLGLALPTWLAAVAALTLAHEEVRPSGALAALEWRTLAFVAAALALGDAVVGSGLGAWLAQAVGGALGSGGPGARAAALAVVAGAALLGHLLLPSRTARAVVLVPAVALPAAGLGLNPAALVLLAVLASGYCQASPMGAKALAVYARTPAGGWQPGDLRRVAFALLPAMAAIALLCAALLWPLLGLPLTAMPGAPR